MSIALKPIDEQAMVITGSSSGIGMTTALLAARRGAAVMLAARNERDLEAAVRQITSEGGRASYTVTDVADAGQVDHLADRAVQEFGRIDTWVNNAGVGVYGMITDIPLEDMRRQFDVNYWGTVHGSLAALRRMEVKGGAIVNVASALADRAVPLQGNYCASKHAVKAFTDALRMEVAHDGIPVSFSLVKPGSTDTPLFEKAKSYMGKEPQPIPPVYRPEVVAKAILACAQRPIRDITVGMGKVLEVSQKLSPRLTDRYMERTMFENQQADRTIENGRADNLYRPVEHDGGRNGKNWQGRVLSRSAYTEAVLHPRQAAIAGAAIGLLLAWGYRRLTQPRTPEWLELLAAD